MASRSLGWATPRQVISMGIGLALSVVLMALTFAGADWAASVDALATAHPWPWVPLAVGCYLAGHVVRGLRCRALVSVDANLSRVTATHVVVLGYAANNVLPGRLGELLRASMLSTVGGIPTVQGLSITFVERVLDAATILGMLLLVITVVGASDLAAEVAPLAALVVGAGLAGVAGLVLFPQLVLGLGTRVASLLPDRAYRLAVQLLVFVTHGASALRRPELLAIIVGQSVVVWVLEAGMFLCVLPAFGLPPDPWWAMGAMALTNLGILVPSSPGYIGSFHFFCSQALMSFGVDGDVALPYAIVVHLTFFVPITLWGGLAAMSYGVTMGSTLGLSRDALGGAGESEVVGGAAVIGVQAAPAVPDALPSRRLTALVQATLHRVTGALPAEEAAEVRAHAASFVHQQLLALPWHLRFAFSVGTTAFFAYARLTTLRGFADLAPDRQAVVLETWSHGPVPLTRALFRVLRSTALLAGCEHPHVVRRLEGA